VIARFQIDSGYRFWVESEVDGENFEGHIVVVHLVVAESDVDIDGVEVFIFNQEFLVNLSCLFVVRSEVVQGSQAQLVLNSRHKRRMILHYFVVITSCLLSQVEQQSVPQRRVLGLHCLFLRVLKLTERIHAASFIRVDILIVI